MIGYLPTDVTFRDLIYSAKRDLVRFLLMRPVPYSLLLCLTNRISLPNMGLSKDDPVRKAFNDVPVLNFMSSSPTCNRLSIAES